MNNTIKVPSYFRETKAIFLCNFRLVNQTKELLEDFHTAYIDGRAANAGFKYSSPLELEYGFAITSEDEVRTFVNEYKNETCHFNHYILIPRAGKNGMNAYNTALKMLENTSNLKLAFTFSTDMLFPYGTVLYRKNEPFSAEILEQKIERYKKDCIFGKVYLTCIKEDGSITVQEVSSN